jgi:hypothetical protein
MTQLCAAFRGINNMGRMFWRCRSCIEGQGFHLTSRQYQDGTLVIGLEWTEGKAELTKDGFTHSVESYENAICSQQPTPKGYKIVMGHEAILRSMERAHYGMGTVGGVVVQNNNKYEAAGPGTYFGGMGMF